MVYGEFLQDKSQATCIKRNDFTVTGPTPSGQPGSRGGTGCCQDCIPVDWSYEGINIVYDALSALPGEKVPKRAHYQVPLSTLILSQTNSKSFHHNTPRQFDAKNSKKPCLQSSLLFAPSCAQAVLVGLAPLLCSISVKDVINQKTYYQQLLIFIK